MVPVEATDVVWFTPNSLKHIDNPPCFRLRSPDERHARRIQRIMIEEGLKSHSNFEVMNMQERAISELWDDETAKPILEKYREIRARIEQNLDVGKEDQQWAEKLEDHLYDNYRDLRVMQADKVEYEVVLQSVMLTTMVSSWKNLDTPFLLESGFLKSDISPKINKALNQIEKANSNIEGVSKYPGVAFVELVTACIKQTRLTEDEEKNLQSPSANSANLEHTTALNQSDGKFTEESAEVLTSLTDTNPAPTNKSKKTAGSRKTQKT